MNGMKHLKRTCTIIACLLPSWWCAVWVWIYLCLDDTKLKEQLRFRSILFESLHVVYVFIFKCAIIFNKPMGIWQHLFTTEKGRVRAVKAIKVVKCSIWSWIERKIKAKIENSHRYVVPHMQYMLGTKFQKWRKRRKKTKLWGYLRMREKLIAAIYSHT